MVDFAKLRTKQKKAAPIEPLEIFRRLPKPPGINDLYTSQAEVLDFRCRVVSAPIRLLFPLVRAFSH